MRKTRRNFLVLTNFTPSAVADRRREGCPCRDSLIAPKGGCPRVVGGGGGGCPRTVRHGVSATSIVLGTSGRELFDSMRELIVETGLPIEAAEDTS